MEDSQGKALLAQMLKGKIKDQHFLLASQLFRKHCHALKITASGSLGYWWIEPSCKDVRKQQD